MRTDRHDNANSRFSHYSERAWPVTCLTTKLEIAPKFGVVPWGPIWPMMRTTDFHHRISLAVSATVYKWLKHGRLRFYFRQKYFDSFLCVRFWSWNSLRAWVCLRFNVHHTGTEISFQLTYDNTNKAVRKWSTLVTLNTFLALCFYIKQLSNNTWRKKACSPRHLRSLSTINSLVHVLTWMSRKFVSHVTLLRTLDATVAAIFQPLTAQLIYSTECSITNPTNKRCLTKTRDSI